MHEMRKIMETIEKINESFSGKTYDDDPMLEQAANPVNTVTVDIPLLIRLLEFARDDAQTDQDLHSLTDNMVNLSPDSATLTMVDYEELVMGLAGDEEIAYDPQPGDDEPLKHGWHG